MLIPRTFASTGRALRTISCCLCAVVVLLQLAATDPARAQGGSWPWPLLGDVVTQYKNGSDPYAAGQHRGVDIAAPAGTPARAVVAGKITYSGRLPDGGETVTIRSAISDHLVSYLHLEERLAKRGATVVVGEVLGRVGVTGRRSLQQPHLHLSVRIASTKAYVNPLRLLGPMRVAERPAAAPAQPSAEAPAEIESLERPATAKQPRVAPIEARALPRINSIESPAAADNARGEARNTRSTERAARIGEKAPAPLPVAAERAPDFANDSLAVDQEPSHIQAVPQATMPADAGQQPPFRAALIALGALALIALILNRKPPRRTVRPASPAPSESVELDTMTQVVSLDGRRRASR